MELCCDLLEEHLNKTCGQHESPHDCDTVIVGPPVMKRWGLPVHDGGHSYIQIKFCPFCGSALMSSLDVLRVGVRIVGEPGDYDVDLEVTGTHEMVAPVDHFLNSHPGTEVQTEGSAVHMAALTLQEAALYLHRHGGPRRKEP